MNICVQGVQGGQGGHKSEERKRKL